MRYIAVLALLFATTLAAPNVVSWFNLKPAKPVKQKKGPVDIQDTNDEFQNFKSAFSKIYEDFEEEKKRFDVFKENLEKVRQHNKEYEQGKHTYYLGINQFADMKQNREEFIKHKGLRKARSVTTVCSSMVAANNHAPPETVDWRTKGYVTGVKNQGSCTSDWSFSASGSLEGQHFKKTGELVSLSEQQMVDCSAKFGNKGCNGGVVDQAFKYIKEAGGLESEVHYPYEAEVNKCRFDDSGVVANLSGCVDVAADESALMDAVANIGPISVAIDASHQSFRFYAGGVYYEPDCNKEDPDHGVLAVGYGKDNNGNKYWLVKNSWGSNWGEEGYIKMARNKNNMCGIATRASYPLV